MINFYDVTKQNIKQHNPNRPQIPDHPYRILIIGGSGSTKTHSLFNSISDQADIDKIYLYAKNTFEAIQDRRNRGDRGAADPLPQVFAKADLLLIDNDSEKKKIATKCKLVQIPRKHLVALLMPTSYNA